MSATDFEAAYLDVYLHDDSEFSDAVFPVVDRFFAEVDSFVADPVLRQRVIQGIGADELRQCARGLLASAGYEHVRSG
jgi:hypothetical protein